MRSVEANTHAALRSEAMHEWLEHLSLTLRADSWTRVLHGNDETPFVLTQADGNRAMLRRVFDRIAQQVIHYGFHNMLIEEDFLTFFCRG